MGIFADLVNDMEDLATLMGRNVTLRHQTGVSDIDPAKPWEGLTESTTDTTVPMIFSPFKFGEMDDTLVQSGDVKVFVSAASLGAVEPSPGDLLVDGSEIWRVMRVQHFKPNEDSIAFEIQARKASW